MKRILVTSLGTVAAGAVVASLRKIGGVEILGADINEARNIANSRDVDAFYRFPSVVDAEKTYVDQIQCAQGLSTMEDKSKKIPITVLVPTINAEPHMEELLDGVQPFFEDVIVVDSLSCDRTVDICLRRGVKIIQRPFVTSGDQYGWMVTKIPVTTPWLMTIDQDERISPELRRLMAENVTDDAPFSGFMTRWRLWFMGGPLHAAPWRMNVYRVGKVAVTDVTCNEHFYLTDGGPVGRLDGIIENKDTPTLWDWYEKQNLYTTREAIGVVLGKARSEKPKLFGTKDERNHWLSLTLHQIPLGIGYLIMFLGYYLLYGAWKDGWAGFYWARCRVWVKWVTEFKVKEIRRTGVIPKMPEPRRGTFDARVMRSELQRRLLPEVVEAWERQRRDEPPLRPCRSRGR